MQQYSGNGRYIEFRGEPILVVGSGEHYGAVLNRDFDYVPYLETLERDGLNQCRVFSGTYREVPGEFAIEDNNIAPRGEAFLCPWKCVGTDRWDLSEWDDAYWSRLRDFCEQAARRGVLVEYVLFCFWYNDNLWKVSPMHPDNTIQAVGPRDRARVFRLEEPGLLPYQEAFVRKATAELSVFDNVYLEICNEPYSRHDGTMDDDWHRHLTAIAKTEDPKKLIAVNYQNKYQLLHDLDPLVTIGNFHYAEPRAARDNYHLGLVLADDETGFAGQPATPYRREAWRFLLAGGAIFSHLDYSFTVQHPDGTAPIGGKTPGYGGADLRQQLGFLRRFLEDAKVWEMSPLDDIISSLPSELSAQVMGIPGERYALYLEGVAPSGGDLQFRIGTGEFTITWHDPVACRPIGQAVNLQSGGDLKVSAPGEHSGELALLITRTGSD
ncbi:MAG: hypothetical protein V4671_05930 [Armatimonadota bacterium]